MEADHPCELLHHSDHGSQHTREKFQRLMAEHGIQCSLSRAGDVWNNAAIESVFSSLQTERTAANVPNAERCQGLCVRLHREVRQSSRTAIELGYLSPITHEE